MDRFYNIHFIFLHKFRQLRKHISKMEQRYPNIFDIKILISAATANATINAITFINGQGMLLNL